MVEVSRTVYGVSRLLPGMIQLATRTAEKCGGLEEGEKEKEPEQVK